MGQTEQTERTEREELTPTNYTIGQQDCPARVAETAVSKWRIPWKIAQMLDRQPKTNQVHHTLVTGQRQTPDEPTLESWENNQQHLLKQKWRKKADNDQNPSLVIWTPVMGSKTLKEFSRWKPSARGYIASLIVPQLLDRAAMMTDLTRMNYA